MSILDIFKVKKMKAQIEELEKSNSRLHSLLKPEHQEINNIMEMLDGLKKEKKQIETTISQSQYDYEKRIYEYNHYLNTLNIESDQKRRQLIDLDEQIMLQTFALYEPKFDFVHSSKYKTELDYIRSEQKRLIKEGTACTGNMNWTVNNSSSQGKKMVNDMIKLLLRSFNNECDACVSNVKFNNIVLYEKRIETSYSTINKLGKVMNISITDAYKRLKLEELYLAHEFQLRKQEEKEEQRQIREQMREEARLQRELEEARKNVEKEKRHYNNALAKINDQLMNCKSDEESNLLRIKAEELLVFITDIEQKLQSIDYREANQRAGYVYIISNIGSFGEGVYKIGMTRRLDPYDRVYELGDASVPFNFDVHAMIFSNDAPKLEAALHREFDHLRLNAINRRREYFKVSLDEIEDVVRKNHDQTIEFVKTSAAEEFRETQLVKKNSNVVAIEGIRQAQLQAAASTTPQ